MKHLVRSSAMVLSVSSVFAMPLMLQGCGTESSPVKSESKNPENQVALDPRPINEPMADGDSQLPQLNPGASMVRVPFDAEGNAVVDMAEVRLVDASYDDRVLDAASAAAAWEAGRTPERLVNGPVVDGSNPLASEIDADLSTASYHVDRYAYRGNSNSWNRNYRPNYYRGGFSFTFGTPGFYMGVNPGYGYSGGFGRPCDPRFNNCYGYGYRMYPRYGYYYYPSRGGYWGRYPYRHTGHNNRYDNRGRYPNRGGYNDGRYRH